MCIFARLANFKKSNSSLNSKTSSGYFSSVKNGFEMIFGKIDMINIISLHFAIVAIIVLMAGWNLAENKGLVNVVGDSYSEWLGILVDAMLLYFINWAIRREEKDKLINQFASESNSFALDATKRLRKKGWLVDGRLNGIDMTHAQLDQANLNKAALQETNFSYASMKKSNLVEADFSNSNLTGADLSNSECRWANFENANLRWANLEGATLDGVNFEGADLRFARLGEINESTVSLEGALLSQTLTEDEIALVQGSVKNIRASMEEFTTDFYRELFNVNPMVERLFISNIKSQVIKFAQVFELLVTSLNDIEKLLPALKSLGKRHNNYGVEEYHYQIVGATLITTLKKSLGQHFTPEVEGAWLKTYGLVTMVMVDSSKGLM
ncbi:MAG: pentapeptide repeat-containing protein [Saprospiraceae bacterium]